MYMNKDELINFLDEKLPNECFVEVTGEIEYPSQNNSLYDGKHTTPIIPSNTSKGVYVIKYTI